MNFLNKTNLCIMSMELIFILVFIKAIDVPIYFGQDWEFIGWSNLFLYRPGNVISALCLLGVMWSEVVYWQLRHKVKGSPTTISGKISNVVNKDVEYLSLLFTILTVVSFDLGDMRDVAVFIVVLLLYYVLLKSTDWYATDPILRLRGLHLYSGETAHMPKGTIFLSFEEISSGQDLFRPYQKISKTVYWLYDKSK